MTLPILKTYIAPTTRSLLRHLNQSLAPPSNSVNLFALSARADNLGDAVAYLTKLPNSVGALTASSYKGVQLAIASYPSASCIPFRSTVPGVPQAEVGRIRTYRPPTRGDEASEARLNQALSDGNINWNDALSKSGSLELPPDLQHIRNNSNISSLFYLSDGAPEGLLDSLQRHFPSASQLGIIGSSTPFITGRPFTLFKGSGIFSDGAVGLALFDQKACPKSIKFSNIRAVSATMEVTQAQTNMVETLDKGNPVESLLLAMKSSGSPNKDQDIYLAVLDPKTSPTSQPPIQKKYSRMYKITAGGPSRGSILLDAVEGPQIGAQVQFVVIESPNNPPPIEFPASKNAATIALSVLPDPEIEKSLTEPEVHEIDNVFSAASENGIVLGLQKGMHSQRPWICTVPGATCST